jgi:Mor family transcriptional regulator
MSNLTAAAFHGVLAQVAELTSAEVAVKMARHWGGQNLYIPRAARLSRDHILVAVCGPGYARRICDALGGERYQVPAEIHLLRALDARALADAGTSYGEIARKIGVTRRHVGELLRGYERGSAPPPRSQPDDRCALCGHRRSPRRPRAAGAPDQFTLPLSGPEEAESR